MIETAVVAAIVLVASTVQTVAGFGFALIGMPLLMNVIGVRDAVVLITITSVVNTALVAQRSRAVVPWRRVSGMLAGCVAGLPVGLAVLLLTPEHELRVAVGVTTVTMALVLAAGVQIERATLARDLAVGFVSGVLNTSTGMNGPPVVLYLQGLRLAPPEFRAALAMFFTITSLLTLGAFVAKHVVSGEALRLALVTLPCVLVGNWLGHRLLARVDPRLFRRLVLALLVLTGLSAAAAALPRVLG